jgi:hypothetical protein
MTTQRKNADLIIFFEVGKTYPARGLVHEVQRLLERTPLQELNQRRWGGSDFIVVRGRKGFGRAIIVLV